MYLGTWLIHTLNIIQRVYRTHQLHWATVDTLSVPIHHSESVATHSTGICFGRVPLVLGCFDSPCKNLVQMPSYMCKYVHTHVHVYVHKAWFVFTGNLTQTSVFFTPKAKNLDTFSLYLS